MSKRFQDRTVVVTGGASGIGAAVARAFAAEGARVAVVDVDAEAGQRLVGSLPEPDAAELLAYDVADAEQRAQVMPQVEARFGRVDVLVNNAAVVGRREDALGLTEEDWQRVFATNLTSAAFLCRDLARMVAREGHPGAIVNITAIQPYLPVSHHVSYVASKGGLAALTKVLAMELAPYGVRVNAVAPGAVETPGMALERERHQSEGRSSGAVGHAATLLGRMGTPDEVAPAVLFLASAEASFVTGAELTVDGGRRISRRADFLSEPSPPITQGAS